MKTKIENPFQSGYSFNSVSLKHRLPLKLSSTNVDMSDLAGAQLFTEARGGRKSFLNLSVPPLCPIYCARLKLVNLTQYLNDP